MQLILISWIVSPCASGASSQHPAVLVVNDIVTAVQAERAPRHPLHQGAKVPLISQNITSASQSDFPMYLTFSLFHMTASTVTLQICHHYNYIQRREINYTQDTFCNKTNQ